MTITIGSVFNTLVGVVIKCESIAKRVVILYDPQMRNEIWIIGAGRFGLRAARKLTQMKRGIHLRLVDPSETNLSQAAGPHRTLDQADGVTYLANHLHPDDGPEWIIPALPIHLAAEWCLFRLRDRGLRRIALPGELESLLPNPFSGSDRNLYVSHANFTCPVHCTEPPDFCTVTRKPRQKDMFAILENIKLPPFQSIVIRSCQIGPGIGGYRPKQLFGLLNQIEKIRGSFMLTTACCCHGVITGLQHV